MTRKIESDTDNESSNGLQSHFFFILLSLFFNLIYLNKKKDSNTASSSSANHDNAMEIDSETDNELSNGLQSLFFILLSPFINLIYLNKKKRFKNGF